MKKEYIIIPIVILALLAALSAPASADESCWDDTFSDETGIAVKHNVTVAEGNVTLAGGTGTDHNGASWTPANGAEISGVHYNIGTFTVAAGTTVYVAPYATETGLDGSLEIHAGTINILGELNGTGRGYPGGAGAGHYYYSNYSCWYPGRGTGDGGTHNEVDGAGQYPPTGEDYKLSSGGGGGYGGEGGLGCSYWTGYSGVGDAPGGDAYGTSNTYLLKIGASGAGGGGGCPEPGCDNPPCCLWGGNGGAGGAGILLDAATVTIDGAINVNADDGGDGETGYKGCGGGGGGAGGSIVINAGTLSGSGSLYTEGGDGGDAGDGTDPGGHAAGGAGGGAGGRIKVWYESSTFSGSYSVMYGSGGACGMGYYGNGIDGFPGEEGTYYSTSQTYSPCTPGGSNYKPSGYLKSIAITPSSIESWSTFSANHTENAETNISYQILNATDDSTLCTITASQAAAGYDISSCADATDSIRLYADLNTMDPSNTPVLHDWTVCWIVTVVSPTPSTPFLVYGWVNDSDGAPVNDPDVNVTNTNTSETYEVETITTSNYYQVSTCSDNVSAGDVLHFIAVNETTTHIYHEVTEADMNRGGFEQNITIETIPYPDLTVTLVNAYHNNTDCSPWFNLSNEIDVKVENTGEANAIEAFNVSVTVDDGYSAKQNVPGGLNVGDNVTLTFTGWIPIGEDCFNNCAYTDTCHNYTITGVADCDNDVEERYEENNGTTVEERACYNGYTGDEPLENAAHGILNGHLNFTTGNGTYGGLYSVGDTRTTGYEITIPENASIELAKLNVYYTWHYETSCPQMRVSIANESGTLCDDILPEERYNDIKCTYPEASYIFPWGNYVYNVTQYITGSGTYTVTVTRTGGSEVSIAAPGIVYVYEDENAPTIEYWINEGADILLGGRRYPTSSNLAWWECINNATFPASTGTGEMASATLGVVTLWGDDVPDDILFFNDIELGRGVYSGYSNTVDETIDGISMYIGSTDAQVGVNVTDVKAQYVHESENIVGQADDGDNTMPCNAFLVVEYTEKEGEKDDVAIAEATMKGDIIAGNFTSTHVSDDEYEAIKETLQGPRSVLEHEWTINVTGGTKTNVTFYVKANRTDSGEGDDFEFAYWDESTGKYITMVTVNSTNETYYTYSEMPTDISGNVTICVKDTDRGKGNKNLDTIYINHMFIRSVLAAPSYGVSVTMEPASQTVTPGNITTYNVTVTNTGDFNASYSVVMSGTAVNEPNNITVNPLNWNTGILAPTAEDVQIVTVYTDASTPEETYTLTATAICDNDTNVADSDTSYLVVSSAEYTDDKAIAESTAKGNVIGDYRDTHLSDNKSEAIEEVLSGGNPAKRYSLLEHEWTIDVTSGSKTNVTFHLKANRTDNTEGDDFKFEYSTDGSTYHDLVTVNKSVEDIYSCKMLNELNGNVTIRVTDTDRKSGNQTLDTIYIDHMYIRSVFGTPEPGVMHADNITMWNTSKGPNYKIYTQVTIVDADNKSVGNATVELDTTSPSNNTESFSGVTDVDGLVTFMYGPTKEKGTYTSTVTNVTKAGGWEYNQSANVVTNKTHTVN